MLLGCAGGAFFAGTLADKYGRRSLLIVTAALFIISAWDWVLQYHRLNSLFIVLLVA
jgi:MFS family permease